MNQTKWILHPIFVFILSILALGVSLFLYIFWYVEVSAGLYKLADKINIDTEQVLAPQTWVVVMVLSILVGFILMGIMLIFIYHQKTYQLYRLQGNFINSFTHELKTPVTSLRLYLETFLRHELEADARRKYTGYMLADINRLSQNINSILNIAKLESKSYIGEFIEADLVAVTEKLCKANQHLFQTCDIQIVNAANQPIRYSIDRTLFEMMLMNFLINAVKYNRSKHPKVRIEFQKTAKKIIIQIVDNGIGIEKKYLKKVFKKFYQVDDVEEGLTGNGRGSGLGLNIAQNITKLHKGKITAFSKGRNKGSVFTITLPCKF